MADRFWVNDDADDDWEGTNNWSTSSGGAGGAATPTAADAAIFDTGSGANNCNLTAASVCLSLTADGDYSGNFDQNGQTLTVSGSCSFAHTGTLTLDAAVTLDADGDFKIAAAVGVTSLVGSDLDLQGTGDFILNKSNGFDSITLAASGKATTVPAAGTTAFAGTDGVLIIGAGTLTLDDDLTVNITTETDPLVVHADATINGSKDILMFNRGTSSTINCPAITITGTAGIQFTARWALPSSTLTVNLTGALSTYDFSSNGYNSTRDVVFNTNDNPLTSAGNSYIASSSTGSTTFNAGSSTMSFGILQGGNVGSNVWNLETATITISSTCTVGTATTIDAGTSSVTFDGTTLSAVTSDSESFYTVKLNKSANEMRLIDAFDCNTFEVDDGDFYMNGQTLTTVGNITIDGDNDITLDAAVLITGNGSFHLGSTINSATLTSSSIELQGTGNWDIDFPGLTFPSVRFNVDGGTITDTGAEDWSATRWYVEPGTTVSIATGRTITVTTVIDGDINGDAGGEAGGDVVLTAAGEWNYVNPASMTVLYVDVTNSNATNSIDATDASNTDGTGNTNWDFGGEPSLVSTLGRLQEAGQAYGQTFWNN